MNNTSSLIVPHETKIGLFAPASPVPSQDFEEAKLFLNKWNISSTAMPSVLEKVRYNAGSVQRRFEEFISLWEDPSVTHLWALRGGYGCLQLYNKISEYFSTKKTIAKPLMGFSDITVLLCGVHYFFPTEPIFWHGPTLSGPSFLTSDPEYQKRILEMFLLNKPQAIWHSFSLQEQLGDWDNISNEPIRGPIIGGNLTLLASLCGTKWLPNLTDKIVFIEDWKEAPYRIDRLLTQLVNSASLNKAKALVIGELIECENSAQEAGWLSQMLKDFSNEYPIPVLLGAPFGHGLKNIPFALGSIAEINAELKTIEIKSQRTKKT